MPIRLSFVNATALTLLTAAPLSSRSPQRQSPSYRISTTVCMNTRRTRTKGSSDSAQLSSPANSSDGDQLDDPPTDPLLSDADGDEIDSWAPDPDKKGVDDLLLDPGDDETDSKLSDDEEFIMAAGFEDDELLGDDDDEEDAEDEDDQNGDGDDDDEDDELAAHADGEDDFDHDISIATLDKRDRGLSSRRMTLDPDDEDEDVDDVDEMIEPISEELEPIFEDDESTVDVTEAVETESEELPPEDEEEEIPEDFDEESEEEIQNAAKILSESGLLGLGVEGGKRSDVSAVKDFAMGRKSSVSQLEEEFDDEGLPLALDEEDEEVEEDDEEKAFIEDYPDLDDEDENGFTLTSQSSFGRVWELNEDTYVTITEPGQSYAYELDEEDEEDQEMASVRRGKQGGWSGGLASYPADSLPKGSREWIARRSYELMTKATPREMFRWTRRHAEPPQTILDLYPDDPPAPTPLGKTTLKLSSPTSDTPTIGRDTSGSAGPAESQRREDPSFIQNPLERSIKFPCTYKFKVEGAGEDFPECLRETVEMVLGKKFTDLQLEVEPAGRYERVIIPVEVESAQQVTLLYDALRNNPSVKFSFG